MPIECPDVVDQGPQRGHHGFQSTFASLKSTIDHAAHLLPAQGPITVFIHHNTLHAFEHLPFEEGVLKGAMTFGCQPYLTEERFRQELDRGRIRVDELRAVVVEDLKDRAAEPIPPSGTLSDLRMAMLQHPVRSGPTGELRWLMAESDALRRFRPDASAALKRRMIGETRRWVMRDLRGARGQRNGSSSLRSAAGLDGLLERFGIAKIESWNDEVWETVTLQALWRICRRGATRSAPSPAHAPVPVRHRDLLLRATGFDTDQAVHELLIRFCGAFVDQGFAHWPLPRREDGFYGAFCAVYGVPGGAPDRWRGDLVKVIADLEDRHVGPLQSIAESLEILGVSQGEWDEFISETLLALRGWAGIISFIEQYPDRAVQPVPKGSLVEFLAVRLILERLALAHAAREALDYNGPLNRLRDFVRETARSQGAPSIVQHAFLVFHLAQLLGWTPEELFRMGPEEWSKLVREIDAFSEIDRRRVFHLAYERRFNVRTLDAMALHERFKPPWVDRPRFQAACCLDEREESFRRHLEEVAGDVQTFGPAGFFNVAMYYRGFADAHYVPLCPIVVKPLHWVIEEPGPDVRQTAFRKLAARKYLGVGALHFHVGTRGLTLGAVLSSILGVLATIPLVARTLFPRLTARIRRWAGRIVEPPPDTHLKLERKDSSAGPDGEHVGYTLEELANVAERWLRDIGLISGFARLFFTLGHGSSSLNNPHKSAYDCGACGGAPGAPNGRAIAAILNDPRVRERVKARGIMIPDDTWFVGGAHNTCNDTVTLFDTHQIPETHRPEFERALGEIDEACARNAHERCRRFMSAPLDLTFAEAWRHVHARSEDLAQTRPELGHATNAICIVGRRERTRGLYFDRRAFLAQYNPTTDDEKGSTLVRILSAAVPVCGGINLEYYFSHVDPQGYGCGTKLPHNVSALVGVMNGAADDLRTGLPWQMTEIHEPVRLLFIIETRPEVILRIMDEYPGIGGPIKHGWVHLTIQDPDSNQILIYRDGSFTPYIPQATHLPRAASSTDWYRGWRDHLEFGEIGEEPARDNS